MKPKTIGTAIALTLISTQTACAYIDPGTAGMIAGGLGSGIWAAIIMLGAGVTGFLVRYFWEPIKSLFGKGSNTKETPSSENKST